MQISQVTVPKSMQFALFVTGLLWMTASRVAADRSAQGIATRFNLSLVQPLLCECFFLFLLLCGFAALTWIATREGSLRGTNALPARPTASREWQLGAAHGWAMLLAAVLPMMLAGRLHSQFWLAPRAWMLALISLATLAVATLALEVAFRGFVFRKLIAALGPVTATVLLSLLYAFVASFRPYATGLSFAVTFLTGLLFSMAYLRTHALWLGWGLHFAWDAAMGVLFGLPVAGLDTYASLVSTRDHSPVWLTGGAYGPEGALITLAVVVAGIAVLYRVTRDYAWEYTHAPIVAAGHAVVIAPPAAHSAMEAAAAPAPLVQILGATPDSASTLPVIVEHLKASSSVESAE